MSELLLDKLNLEILEHICSGTGVAVNINALSKSLNKHRNTIKKRVQALFENNIINKPIHPFLWLYQEYSLLVVSRAELPRNETIDRFLKEDPHIFGAFYQRDEVFNTFLIEFHRDIYSYGEWRKRITAEGRIPPRESRYPSDTLFFTVKNFIKYQPYSPIFIMENKLTNGKELVLNGYKINDIAFRILKKLMVGEGIRTNESLLSRKLDVHRKTVERRINSLLEERIVSKPLCRFPNFFVPPNHLLVFCLMEIKKSRDKIIKAIRTDPCVPLAIEANIGRYNLLLFKVFFSVESHFRWGKKYDQRFPDCIGAMKKLFLPSEMIATIDQQKVSLSIIKHRKKLLHGKELIDSVTGTVQ